MESNFSGQMPLRPFFRCRVCLCIVGALLCRTSAQVPNVADPAGGIGGPASPLHADAIQSLRRSEYARAIERCEEILKGRAADPSAHLLLALAQAGKGDVGQALATAERAGKVDSKLGIEVYRKLGSAYGNTKRYHPAVVCLTRALQLGDNPDAAYELAVVYMAQGEMAKARPLLEKVLSARPEYLALARVCMRLGDHTHALQHARKVLEHDPENQGALLVRGISELMLGNAAGASETLRRMKRDSSGRQLSGHFLGLTALIREDYAGALAEGEQVLKLFPNLREGHLISALSRLMLGQYAEARSNAGVALLPNTNDAVANLVLAAAALGDNKRDEAQMAFRRAAPMLFELGSPLAEIFAPEKNWNSKRANRFALACYLLTEGVAFHTRALLTLPESGAAKEEPFFAILRAKSELALGNRSEGEKILRQLVSHPRLVTPLIELALLAVRDGRGDLAAGFLREAESRAGESVPFHLLAGELAFGANEIPAAKAHFGKALRLNPKSAAACNQLAWTLSEKDGRYAEALPLAAAALQLEPDNSNSRDTLGWVHYRLGNYSEAAKVYNPLLKSLPRHSAMLYRMSLVVEKAGRKEAAADLLEKALNLSGDFPGASAAGVALQSIWDAK